MSKDKVFGPECVLYACCGSKCKKRGGKQMYKALRSEIKLRRLKRVIQVIKTGCTDRCKHGPILAVMPQNEWHHGVDEAKGRAIVNALLRSD